MLVVIVAVLDVFVEVVEAVVIAMLRRIHANKLCWLVDWI
jgi:hypothetical protein